MASKWEPFMDDGGNLYFYNHVTGESVWELPPEEAEDDEPPEVEESLAATPDKELSEFVVAAGVVDTVVGLVQAVNDLPSKSSKKKVFISPAAAARRQKNDAKCQRRKQRELGIAAERYMALILPPVTDTALSPGKKEDEDKNPRRVGSLFTLEDSAQWQREVEEERIRERRANRKYRHQHRVKVRSLKEQQRLLLQLRSEMTNHLLGDIRCSADLLKQRILLLSSQSTQSILATSNLEPEIAEKLEALERQAQQEREAGIKRGFELLDSGKTGRIRLLNVLTGVFAYEAQIQQLASGVQGLSILLSSPRLQQIIVGFASRKQNDCAISFDEFRDFVGIVEDVWNYFSSIKRAVEDAENEIDAAFEVAAQRPGTGAARARMGLVSKKKAEHELAQLQEKAALVRSVNPAEMERDLWRLEPSFIEPKEEWEKNHHHRYIQFSQNEPLYCCLCRRKKWDLFCKLTDDEEQSFRATWSTVYELRLKEAEIRLLGGDSPLTQDNPQDLAADTVECVLTDPGDFITQALASTVDDFDIVVLETLQAVVLVVESLESEPSRSPTFKTKVYSRVHRRHPRKIKKKPKLHDIDYSTENSPLQTIGFDLKAEEFARRTLFEEERSLRIEIERFLRRKERPLLRFQEAAQDEYTRILERCVSLPPLLTNLVLERCLSMVSAQQLTLLAVDSSSPTSESKHDNRIVLYTVPHRKDSEVKHIFQHLRLLQQRLNSLFIANVQLVDVRTYQNFSESGMLIESWPVQFVAAEYFPHGSWHDFFHEQILTSNAYGYAQVEQHILTVFRDIATGISSMHSLGVFHLNIRSCNIYVCSSKVSIDPLAFFLKPKIKIAGLLAWKNGYDANCLAEGDILDRLHFNYAPPEALDHKPITAKADVWMLGCALFDTLLSWQHSQLVTSNQPNHSHIIFSSCSIPDLLLMLPLSTGAPVRSLLRMLLQREPRSRPDMTQVAEYITFAGVTQTLASRP